MTDPYARTPQGLFDRIMQRLQAVEERLGKGVPSRLASGGLQVTDWNLARSSGYYWADAGAANAPFNQGFVGQVTAIGGGAFAGRVRQQVWFPTLGDSNRVTWSRVWTGTAWTPWKRSDGLMAPTSIASTGATATYDAETGRILLPAGLTGISLNGVFTTEFRAYEVRWHIYSTVAWSPRMRLRTLGVDDSSTNYQWAMLDNNGSSGSTADANMVLSRASINGHFGIVEIREPMYVAGTANQKRWIGESYAFGSNLHSTFSGSITARDTTPFDGFTLFSNTSLTVQGGSAAWITVKGVS